MRNSQGSAASAYASLYPNHCRSAATLRDLLPKLIDVESINYQKVEVRAKEPASFAEKAARRNPDGSIKYSNPLNSIEDQVAVRIITFIPEDVERVCALIRAQFVVKQEIDKGEETKKQGRFGYASKHLIVRLSPTRAELPENACFGDHPFEIQVRTVVQHAWAEFEHDIRYKGSLPTDLKPQMDRSFALAAALLEMADKEFDTIDRLVQQAQELSQPVSSGDETSPQVPPPLVIAHPGPPVRDSVPLTESTLQTLLSRKYVSVSEADRTPRSRRDHYIWMLHMLAAADIRTVEGLTSALTGIASRDIVKAMNHQMTPGQIRRLDDEMLAALGPRWIDISKESVDANRAVILRKRLAKLQKAGVVR